MIKEKIGILHGRGKPTLLTEFDTDGRYKREKYKYYLCDYCQKRINMSVPRAERTGGTMTLSYVLTKNGTVTIACCNGCVNKVLAEFSR